VPHRDVVAACSVRIELAGTLLEVARALLLGDFARLLAFVGLVLCVQVLCDGRDRGTRDDADERGEDGCEPHRPTLRSSAASTQCSASAEIVRPFARAVCLSCFQVSFRKRTLMMLRRRSLTGSTGRPRFFVFDMDLSFRLCLTG